MSIGGYKPGYKRKLVPGETKTTGKMRLLTIGKIQALFWFKFQIRETSAAVDARNLLEWHLLLRYIDKKFDRKKSEAE